MRQTVAALVVVAVLGAQSSHGAPPAAVKEALQELNEFIGEWKGSGGPLNKPRPGPTEIWQEKLSWSWRFKGDDIWLSLTIKDGKYFKGGDLRYLPDKKRYQLIATDLADKKLTFVGELKKDRLVLERPDADRKETQILTMNVAAEGVRFIYRAKHVPEGKTVEINDFEVACTKEGETLGAKEKKIECVVSGGKGTIPVSYKGETFYVCCTGCRDAFNEEPEKYIKEFRARKKK